MDESFQRAQRSYELMTDDSEGQTEEEKQDFEQFYADERVRMDEEERNNDLEYAEQASVTELRRLWRENRNASRDCFFTGDFWTFPALIAYRDKVLIPEFERRGYVVKGQGGMILKEPERKAAA